MIRLLYRRLAPGQLSWQSASPVFDSFGVGSRTWRIFSAVTNRLEGDLLGYALKRQSWYGLKREVASSWKKTTNGTGISSPVTPSVQRGQCHIYLRFITLPLLESPSVSLFVCRFVCFCGDAFFLCSFPCFAFQCSCIACQRTERMQWKVDTKHLSGFLETPYFARVQPDIFFCLFLYHFNKIKYKCARKALNSKNRSKLKTGDFGSRKKLFKRSQ